MATDVVFSVKISGIEGRDIGTAGSSPDPYFKLDFDHLKEHRSAHKKKTSKPVWEDVIEFEYSTKYAQRLPTKELVVEVWDKRTLAADKLLGEARVPLYALFTGPRRVEIALEDRDHKPAGVLSMVVAVEQTVSIAATVSSLTVDLDDASAAVLDVQLGSTLPALMAQRDEAEAASLPSRVPGGQTYALRGDIRTSRAMLQASAVFGAAIVLTVRGSSELQAFLPIHKYFSYDRAAPFEVDLFPAGADPATSAPAGTASGSLRLHELPEYVQMAGGTLLAGAQPPPYGPCIVEGQFLLAEEGVKAPMPALFARGAPGSAVVSRSRPPQGVTFPQPTNRRAGGGGAAGSSGQRRSVALSSSGPSLAATAAAAAMMGGFGAGAAAMGGAGAAVDEEMLRRFAAAGLSSPGSAGSGSASPVPAPAAVPPAALMSLQAAVGRAQAALAAAASTEAQLSRAAESRAASQSASDLQLGDLRRAVQESNATLARLSRREAEVERAATAAATASEAWPEASSQAAALADHASRLGTVHGELVELRGTAEKVLSLRDAALTAHLELRGHSDRVAEQEAARAAGLVAAREEAREVIATASGLVAAGGRASTGPTAVGRAEAALDAAAANLSRLLEQNAAAAAAEASASQTLVGNRDRVVTSVEQATSALAAAEEHTNANYDAEMASAAAQNLAALADPRAAAAAAAAAAMASARPSVASARGSLASMSMGGGGGSTSVSVPGCWERHIAPDEGRPYFENSMTRSTVWALPTTGEYDVAWPEGSRLGIRLEEQDYPHPDAFAKACVILDADGAAGMGAANAEEMGRGHVLLAACGRPLLGKPLGEVLAVIGALSAARTPLSLRFHNPYAVPPAAAAAAANLGVAIVPGPFPAPLPPVRGNPYCAVGAGGAPPPGGPGPAAGGYPPQLPAPGYPSPGGYGAPSPAGYGAPSLYGGGAAPAGYGYAAAPGPYGAAPYGAPSPYGAAPGPAAGYGAYPGYGGGGSGYGY